MTGQLGPINTPSRGLLIYDLIWLILWETKFLSKRKRICWDKWYDDIMTGSNTYTKRIREAVLEFCAFDLLWGHAMQHLSTIRGHIYIGILSRIEHLDIYRSRLRRWDSCYTRHGGRGWWWFLRMQKGIIYEEKGRKEGITYTTASGLMENWKWKKGLNLPGPGEPLPNIFMHTQK